MFVRFLVACILVEQSMSAIECTNFEKLYTVKVTSKGTNQNPDTLFAKVSDILTNANFTKCYNIPVVTQPSIAAYEDGECAKSVFCEKAVDPVNAAKLNIVSANPHLIPCDTWKTTACKSAFRFMEAHDCRDTSVCASCCLISPPALPPMTPPKTMARFETHVFLLGTLLPSLIGASILFYLYGRVFGSEPTSTVTVKFDAW